MAHQKCRAAIDKALGDTVVQRIGQAILDAAGAFLPIGSAVDPVAAMGHVGPGADMGDPHHQRVDIAVEPVELRHLAADPGARQPPFRPGELDEAMRQEPGMAVAHYLAEIRDLADLPEQPDRAGMGRQRGYLGVARQQLERAVVVGVARLDQPGPRRPLVEAAQQGPDRPELQPGIAPGQAGQRVKPVLFDRGDELGIERALISRRAERAVAHMPTGAAGDLCDFGCRELARAAPVELAQAGKGDMVEIHVEAHADRVSGD